MSRDFVISCLHLQIVPQATHSIQFFSIFFYYFYHSCTHSHRTIFVALFICFFDTLSVLYSQLERDNKPIRASIHLFTLLKSHESSRHFENRERNSPREGRSKGFSRFGGYKIYKRRLPSCEFRWKRDLRMGGKGWQWSFAMRRNGSFDLSIATIVEKNISFSFNSTLRSHRFLFSYVSSREFSIFLTGRLFHFPSIFLQDALRFHPSVSSLISTNFLSAICTNG